MTISVLADLTSALESVYLSMYGRAHVRRDVDLVQLDSKQFNIPHRHQRKSP